MQTFNEVIAGLRQHYGKPQFPPAKGPFELVLWENACYLLLAFISLKMEMNWRTTKIGKVRPNLPLYKKFTQLG